MQKSNEQSMSLPPEAIREFQKLYQKEFGIKLSKKEALEQAIKVFALCKFIYSS